MAEKITPDVCKQLKSTGYVVLDQFFGIECSSAFLQEMQWLQQNGLMLPNKTQFTLPNGNLKHFTKPHIYEVDLHDETLRKKIPQLDSLFETHAEALIDALEDEFDLVRGTNGRTIKLQYNEGQGGCFPYHYDNPGRPNRRQISCLLYLNPHWKAGDGGEIQFQPFLGPKVTIEPLMDRLVLFRSDAILHRVLPAKVERFCLTIWLDGKNVNSEQDTLLTRSHLQNWPDFVALLKHSPLQRVVSRGVYADEYLESLTECMKHSDGFSPMLQSHEKFMESISESKNPLMAQIIRNLTLAKPFDLQ